MLEVSKMNFVFIVSLFLTVAVAQQPSLACNYRFDAGLYGCYLTINNPSGFNNFTAIGGIHLEGFADADVEYIYRNDGVSTIVPSIICYKFPNLDRIVLISAGLSELGDTAFSGCTKVTELLLMGNRISSISTNAFVDLTDIEHISLASNLLTSLPEHVFQGQKNLKILNLNYLPFEYIPSNLFRPLENLDFLFLIDANLNSIDSNWFTNNTVRYLYVGSNRIVLSSDSFVGLESLLALSIAYNAINEIPAEAFAPLQSLRMLSLNNNNFTELRADSISDLGNLEVLDISENPIQVIHNDAFRGLVNLTSLYMESCGLRQLHSNVFRDLESLNYISLKFNEIEELPYGVFANSPNLNYIGLWNNRLKTLHRNRFGILTSLRTLDLDWNSMNGLDRSIIDDAVNLDTLYFNGNLCENNFFGSFLVNRAQYLPMLESCFSNMRYIVDTVTEGDNEYSFFEGPHTGIALRVSTDNEVQIALTPINFVWRPLIEILIGTTNNTRSIIRMNQELDVVIVPTPNIIRRDQGNDFRVTWANHNILVYRGNETFPFMSFTMQEFFPVHFFGLRAVESRAYWRVQPFQ